MTSLFLRLNRFALAIVMGLSLFACKTPIVVKAPVEGEIQINPFCAATITPFEHDEHENLYHVDVYCKEGFKLNEQAAYGPFREAAPHLFEQWASTGAIILTREQFQKLIIDLTEAGVIEVR